ncbi:MAG: hypothetical protein IJV07_03570 [Alphaproteobacteria bacterium]|nr:hypothetical protein [Alphaproteobacteria bacterium]
MTDEKDLTDCCRDGLNRALASYRRFQTSEAPLDAKGFTAYHNACKAALLHIAVLLKLVPPDSQTNQNRAGDWLAAAQAALRSETEGKDDELFD